MFTKSEEDIPFVKSIINEQFSQLRPEHQVFVRSIGTPIAFANSTATVKFLQHGAEGSEFETLWYLWRHCQDHPTDKVVYLHSKGSFHPSETNNKLRRFLTRGALSQECANAPSSCNVCSSRISPIPHPHMSGNMWLADATTFKSSLIPCPLSHK